MTVLDLKACQTPLALYFSINYVFCFNLVHFSPGNSCCRNGVAMDYTKNVHNWELKWKAPSSLPCSVFCCEACMLRSTGKQKYSNAHELQNCRFIFRYCNVSNLIKGACMKLMRLAVNDLSVNFITLGISWTSVGIRS